MNLGKLKAQGAFEYLLLIGGAILFVILAIAFITKTINTSSGSSSIAASQAAEFDAIRTDCNAYGVVNNQANKMYLNFNSINDPWASHGTLNNGATLNATLRNFLNSYNTTFGNAQGVSTTTLGAWVNSTLSSATAVGTGDFAFSAWIYPTASANNGNIINVSNNTGTADPMILNISINSTGLFVGAQGFNADSGKVLSSLSGAFMNGWTHIMIKRQSSNLSLWINGTLNQSTTFATNVGNFYGINVGNPAFAGQVDELKFYAGTVTDAMAKFEYRCVRPSDQ